MTMNVVVAGVLLLVLGGLNNPPSVAADFCDNLKQVAATLPKNTSTSPLHFATATFGQAPDVVYALALCRGDVLDDTTCGDCVANTFDKVKPPPPQVCYPAAYYYGGACRLVYSGDNILAPPNTTAANGDDTPYPLWNIKNITAADADDVRLIVRLVHELVVETVQLAASTAPRRFATGVMDSGAMFPKVYSLAQCTPDLSAAGCLACLQRLLGMVNSTMALRMGAQIHVIRCYFRYEAYAFYDSKPMLQVGPSAPAPAPSPNPVEHKRRSSKLWVIPVVVVPLAAVAFLCFIFYSPCFRRYRRGKAMRLQAGSRRTQGLHGDEELVWDGKNSDFSVFHFEQVLEATDSFSEENKLGHGGFGAVYKGQFADGLQIAVKRLASHSGQGFTEFKNEVQLIAKLQHRNLAWQLWDEERWIDIVDASLVNKSQSSEMMRCVNIALLCVQENAADRPTMADVVAMLSTETTTVLAEPKKPAYFNVRVGDEEAPTTATESCSVNDMTISVTTPR
ncbi:Cysteine-rich receptor-like protein kinase 10 [Zea mays]|uniref:Cysteine-rich receptor-like protein kinase 10 n=1 Tax=Zea mays TaxID=4577 RepID=A0A1D6KAW8_MAIZE|nr:Cysteine-rich receptor-like protein kinase 10 [Zea mays]